MKILVTGATGFTGKRVLPLLKDRGEICVFARTTSDLSQAKMLGYRIFYGDLEDLISLKEAMTHCRGLINIASLGFGHADGIVDSAVECGIHRALFVSTTALFTSIPAQSRKIRAEAEKKITDSSLSWTILRPTMIYGGVDDRNMIRLLRVLKKSPIVPIPGGGEALQQPIHVEDLARAIIDAFFSDKTVHKEYNLSGANPLSFNELIAAAAGALHVRRKTVHIPLKIACAVVRSYQALARRPLIKVEQLLRLSEDKAFSHTPAKNDFGFSPRTFETGIRDEAAEGGLL